MRKISILLCLAAIGLANGEDVRLVDLDPPEAQQLIDSKDTTLKYAPKIESNVPAVRYIGNEPQQVSEDIYLANQYHGQDGVGGYLYGYSVPDIAKTERKKAGGDLRGAYNYISGDGQEIKVEYWDDGNGFHQIDNVPKILPKQIEDSPDVKAAKDEHARIWAEEAERNSKPIQNPYPNAQPGAYAGLGAGVGAGVPNPVRPQGQFNQQGQQSYGQQAGQHGNSQQGQQGQGQGGYNKPAQVFPANQGRPQGQGQGQAYGGQQQGQAQQGQAYGGQQGQAYGGQQAQKPQGQAYGGQQQGQGQQGQAYGGQQQGQVYGGQQGQQGQKPQGQAYGGQQQGQGQQGQAYGGQQHGQGSQQGHQQGQGFGGQGQHQGGQQGQGFGGQKPQGSAFGGQQGQQGHDYSGQHSQNQNQYAKNPQQQQQQGQQGQQSQDDGDDGTWKDDTNQEEQGPPKGFFYNIDYPVGIIVSKQGGAQKGASLPDTYNTNKANFEQQLKGGAAVHGGGSYPSYQVHS